MRSALYPQAPNADSIGCPFHLGPAIAWQDDLPPPLQSLVVAPVRFEVHADYEMLADHTDGCDAANQPCYCEFHFVVTELRSDDDEVFFEAPVYAEKLTSWRLIDERWLVCQTTLNRLKRGGRDTRFFVTNTMPR